MHDKQLHDMLSNLMDPDPSQRLELDVVLKHAYFDRLWRLQLQ